MNNERISEILNRPSFKQKTIVADNWEYKIVADNWECKEDTVTFIPGEAYKSFLDREAIFIFVGYWRENEYNFLFLTTKGDYQYMADFIQRQLGFERAVLSK